MKNFYNNKVVLITGSTGSFGKVCVKHLIKNFKLKKIIVLSRDELKQFESNNKLKINVLDILLAIYVITAD